MRRLLSLRVWATQTPAFVKLTRTTFFVLGLRDDEAVVYA